MSMSVLPATAEDEIMLDHQYHAARRRHAGAADHLPDHHSGRDQIGARSALPIAHATSSTIEPSRKTSSWRWIQQGNDLLERRPGALTSLSCSQCCRWKRSRFRSPRCTSAAISMCASKAVGRDASILQRVGNPEGRLHHQSRTEGVLSSG